MLQHLVHHAPFGRLTPRQRQVLGLICDGYSNLGIAQQLVLGRKTVESHINALYHDFGLDPFGPTINPRVQMALVVFRHQQAEAHVSAARRRLGGPQPGYGLTRRSLA